MTARKLDESQWRTFLDRLSKTLEGKQAEIEVASLETSPHIDIDVVHTDSGVAHPRLAGTGFPDWDLLSRRGGAICENCM
jgi:hypothetical protein